MMAELRTHLQLCKYLPNNLKFIFFFTLGIETSNIFFVCLNMRSNFQPFSITPKSESNVDKNVIDLNELQCFKR